jgi:hypothetical protein
MRPLFIGVWTRTELIVGIQYLEENIAAGKLKLSAEDVQTVRDLTAQAGAGLGERYPAGMIALAFADTPALP